MAQPYIVIPPQGSDQADEWMRLGLEAQTTGKFPDAERHYRQALRLDASHALVTQNLAVLYAQMMNLNEAILTIERASLFDNGKHGVIWMNWAFMCLEADRIDEALKAAQSGIEAVPCKETWLAMASILGTAGRPSEAIQYYEKILAEDPKHPQAAPNVCFVQTLTTATPEQLRAKRKGWYEANAYTGEKHGHPIGRINGSVAPLRVGYVSGDFKCHSASMIFSSVLLNHDKSKVLPFYYSTIPVDPVADPMTKEFKESAGENWRDISAMNDEQADLLIRKDRIDILVDLAGHTNGGRLALFTRKPAPIQVTAWGFAHGTGCPEIDYFLADQVSVPEDERKHYAEKIWDVPCVVTYKPPAYDVKGTSQLPYFVNGYFTFASHARYEKFSDDCLETWAEILRQVPESKLQLKDNAYRRPYSVKRVLSILKGIEPKRVLFSISTSHQDHLLAYQQADVILDPFPHSGGVVGLEQLYMGLPIITKYGTQASGRTTSSVLTAMGRTEWIAKTNDEYVEKAVNLTKDVRALADLRKGLRSELMESPVVKGYPQAIESAYKQMWEQRA
jgi:predicted O-linked N-acetylglucosamine transferase (SPINDLY family)